MTNAAKKINLFYYITMKKILFTLILVCSTAFTSYSQFFYGGGGFCLDCYTSIEVGAVSSSISGMDNTSSKIGFHFGVYQFRDISDSFSFRYGIAYNNLGAKMDNPKLYTNDKLIMHSINIPLSLHYNYQRKFQGFLGGELGTNFFGKLPNLKISNYQYDNFDYHENFNLLDASVFVGVGYILIETIDINLKYNFGVTNVSAKDENDWKKNWLTLSVSYTFRE